MRVTDVSPADRREVEPIAMTPSSAGAAPVLQDDGGISFLALGSVLLRWRKTILVLGVLAAALGLADALTKPRLYLSTGTFVPRGSQAGMSGLAAAASQFGFNIGSTGSDWTPPMYVELIRSRALLEPIALDTFAIAEDGGGHVAFMDLLEIKGPTREREVTAAVGVLRGMIEASESRRLGGVTVSVKTKWPSLSVAIANRLLERVNEFNLETRKSQAVAERQFVEGQAQESERTLRQAENRLQSFLQANRQVELPPSLVFERDRLQREVSRESQMYTTWLQSREEARIREIRDIPVITVLESPRLPFREESRKVFLKTALGGMAGLTLGFVLAFLLEAMARARRTEGDDAREFFQLLGEASPRFVRRWWSR